MALFPLTRLDRLRKILPSPRNPYYPYRTLAEWVNAKVLAQQARKAARHAR